jgi:hypothetical protein
MITINDSEDDYYIGLITILTRRKRLTLRSKMLQFNNYYIIKSKIKNVTV